MLRKIKIILSCVVTLCLTVCILGRLTNLMERKDSRSKYADFFEQKENFNVLFMGTSHVINAVQPMELWDDYGIVSYNLGGHANRIATTYWTMENALDYTTPDLVVIDTFSVSNKMKCYDVFSYIHLSLDAFPLSLTKIKTVWDLLDDPALDEYIASGQARKSDEPRTKIGLLWDYSVYHSRWMELTQDDFEPEKNLEKGAESRINVVRSTMEKIDPSNKMKGGTLSEDYLRRMIEDCQSRGINVLLTYLPFPAPESRQREANFISDLANEYGVNYINFLDLDVIDLDTDCYDDTSHLNPSGARKVTAYLGDYITRNYPVMDQRHNLSYSSWYDDYKEYVELKNNNLKSQEKLKSYLMLLAGEKADIVLDVRNKDLYKNEWMTDLLVNIGAAREEITENTDFIIKMNGHDKAVVIDGLRSDDTDISNEIDTEIGTVQLKRDWTGTEHDGEEGYYSVNVNGKEYLTGNSYDHFGLNISVRRDDMKVDTARFAYVVDPNSLEVIVSETVHE